MLTFNYAKTKSINVSDDVVVNIRKAFKASQRAESAYIARNEELALTILDLVVICQSEGLNRAEGGKVLASICNIENLKDDRALANAWQYAASDLPSRQKESNKLKASPQLDMIAPEQAEQAQPTGLEALIADNQITGLADALIAALTADQLDAVAKKISDHINARKAAKLPRQVNAKRLAS